MARELGDFLEELLGRVGEDDHRLVERQLVGPAIFAGLGVRHGDGQRLVLVVALDLLLELPALVGVRQRLIDLLPELERHLVLERGADVARLLHDGGDGRARRRLVLRLVAVDVGGDAGRLRLGAGHEVAIEILEERVGFVVLGLRGDEHVVVDGVRLLVDVVGEHLVLHRRVVGRRRLTDGLRVLLLLLVGALVDRIRARCERSGSNDNGAGQAH